MNTAKIYTDSEGMPRSIYQMVRIEPEWAACRIQEGEKAIDRVKDLEAMLRKKMDLIKCGIGANYSGDPYENILYLEAHNLLNS